MTADSASLAQGMGRWLRSGRVQSANGAFCAWLDLEAGTLAFEYPEITGYALTWLAADGGDGALDAGHRAAGWLVDRLRSGDSSSRAGWDAGAVYTFDLGMIAAGLISFGRVTGTSDYVEEGQRVGETLAGLVSATGELPAIAPSGPSTTRAPQWSTVGRAHLAKCAQSLLLCDRADVALRVCEVALEDQADEGYFVTQPGSDTVMLHPLLYAVEGLWITATATGEARLLESAARPLRWVWDQQLSSGALPRSASATAPGPAQSDVTAQAVRMAILLELDCPGLEAAVDHLLAVARTDQDHGQALLYQADSGSSHLNTWVTMFAEQALRVVTEGTRALSWSTIV